MKSLMTLIPVAMIAVALSPVQGRAENRVDVVRADAPELALRGDRAVGVRTLEFKDPGRVDVLRIDPKSSASDPLPRYDRPLTVEVWYPADKTAKGSTVLNVELRDGETVVPLRCAAVRDAAPNANGGPFPLVVVSHGYPGNRHLLSSLAENIASKGYVVASIDHTDSTYSTYKGKASFASTLLNRPLDQMFVLEQIAKLSRDPNSFLNGEVDADRTALIGYSMGGYGVTVSAGAGLTHKAADASDGMWSAPRGILAVHKSGGAEHAAMFDPRIKAAVAFAPAGAAVGFFDAETLKGIRVPMLIVGGSVDDVVGYEDGIRAIWKGAVNVDRSLLTFELANHNAGAVMPAPEEANVFNAELKMNLANHYIDSVWDNVRMNNISAHFVTAWLGKYLKADVSMDAYLNLTPEAGKGVWAVERDGGIKPEHTYWKGFPNRTAKGLRFESLKAGG